MSPLESLAVNGYETRPVTRKYESGDFSSMIKDAVTYLRPAAMRVHNTPLDDLGLPRGYVALDRATRACYALFKNGSEHLDDNLYRAGDLLKKLGEELLQLPPEGEDRNKYVALIHIGSAVKDDVLSLPRKTIWQENRWHGYRTAAKFNCCAAELRETQTSLYHLSEELHNLSMAVDKRKREGRNSQSAEQDSNERAA